LPQVDEDRAISNLNFQPRWCISKPKTGCGLQVMMLNRWTYFVAAGLCEIGGGYLVWLWLRENRSLWYAIAGLEPLLYMALFQFYRQQTLGVSMRHTAEFL